MIEITQEQREQIAIEEYKKHPTETIAHVAVLKLAELGINTNAENVTQSCNATFNGKRYHIKMIVSYEELK
jgi:hypothetical protein